jgi:hypothetical protein
MLKKIAILVTSILGLLTFTIVCSFRLLTEGSLPSNATALGLREDVVTWAKSSDSLKEGEALPDSVIRLRPLRVERFDHGVLIVFQHRFVEDHGFLYTIDTASPPEGMNVFCSSLGEGVYCYYNPG